MSRAPDQPDFTVPTLGPISKESRWEFRSTIENHGATPLLSGWATGVRRSGKFFPRGCRGFIETIQVYCEDSAVAGGTIYVYIAPVIGMGYTYATTIVVPAGGAPAWRDATFNIAWNYDSLFIWLYVTANIRYGYDAGQPPDNWASVNSGVSWTVGTPRLWARVLMRAETPGDVPISGTINTIEIPSSSITTQSAWVSIAAGVRVQLLQVEGAGEVIHIWLRPSHPVDVIFYLMPDGIELNFDTIMWIDLNYLNVRGHTTSTPKVSLTGFNVGAESYAQITLHIPFKRTFAIEARNRGIVGRNAAASLIARVIS